MNNFSFLDDKLYDKFIKVLQRNTEGLRGWYQYMFDKQSFEDKIRKINDAKQLKSLATSIRVASNRNSISTKDANALIEKANKKAYMINKVHNADSKAKARDAEYTIRKESGREAYNVYVNDKKVKTFGSLVDAQKFVRDYKLGRIS